jgi:predicted hydrolase (HD superfamily)
MDNIIILIGLFFAFSAIVSILFLYLKQSTIIAYIFVGIILEILAKGYIKQQGVVDIISEIGIILLLFLAGMELNIENIKKRCLDTDTNLCKIKRHIEENESKYHHAIYADPLDYDIWEELKFEEDSLIVSGFAGNSDAAVIVNVGSYDEAIELYEKNASYLILSNHLSGLHIIEILEKFSDNIKSIEKNRQPYLKKIKEVKNKFIK